MTGRPSGPPKSLRWAVFALIAYGAVVLVNATVLQTLNDWQNAGDYPRAVIRAVGVTLVGWGLWRGVWWTWWMGIALPLFWIMTSAFAFAMFMNVRTPEADARLPPAFYLMFGVTTALLALVIVLLLLPGSRAACRRRPV